jgi:hypothetical protein
MDQLKRREMMKLVDLPYPCSNGDMLLYSIRSSYFGTICDLFMVTPIAPTQKQEKHIPYKTQGDEFLFSATSSARKKRGHAGIEHD